MWFCYIEYAYVPALGWLLKSFANDQSGYLSNTLLTYPISRWYICHLISVISLGFAQLSGATITRQSYQTSRRDKQPFNSGGVSGGSARKTTPRHMARPRSGGDFSQILRNMSNKDRSSPLSVKVTPSQNADNSDSSSSEQQLSSVLMITCFTTSQTSVCPTCTFYITTTNSSNSNNINTVESPPCAPQAL